MFGNSYGFGSSGGGGSGGQQGAAPAPSGTPNVFGQSQQPPQQQQPQQQSSGFGGGGGGFDAASPFGASFNTMGVGMGASVPAAAAAAAAQSPFGVSQSTTQPQPSMSMSMSTMQQQTPSSGFGASSTTTGGFGGSGGVFGGASVSASNNGGFGGGGFDGSSGGTTSTGNVFGGGGGAAMPAPSTAAAGNTNNNTGSMFGTSSNLQLSSSANVDTTHSNNNTGFAPPSAPSASLGFGMSSNTATTTPFGDSASGFGGGRGGGDNKRGDNHPSGGATTTGGGSSTAAPSSGFGKSASLAMAMATSSSSAANTLNPHASSFAPGGSSSTFGGLGGGGEVSQSPFGPSTSTTTAHAPAPTSGFDASGNMSYTRKPSTNTQQQLMDNNNKIMGEKQEALAKLRAKLEAKKKRMEMKKLKMEEEKEKEQAASASAKAKANTSAKASMSGGFAAGIHAGAPAFAGGRGGGSSGGNSSFATKAISGSGTSSSSGLGAFGALGSSRMTVPNSSTPFGGAGAGAGAKNRLGGFSGGGNHNHSGVEGRIPRKKRNNKSSASSPLPTHNESSSASGSNSNSNANATEEEMKTKLLAQKNAMRFAQVQNRNSTQMLPDDLQEQAKNYDPAAATAAANASAAEAAVKAAENIASTTPNKSLIGTCRHMCPNEELIRREGEGDIQLLEYPHASIHPSNYTLRDTAVKRFRRSAADFKLDIPGLVRPPSVLERVCGYLEEWVMERDRQGSDPRYEKTPPPLDVYQFIWDRTRMIRKDFVLQNYIGTGGKCNAIAVRCHERIARWHALCEHQLSHIPDYARMQSQQNVQELGQTMKTLNMLYDDAGGRSTLEEGAGSGGDGDAHHGCGAANIMGGNPPCEYNNGPPLLNDSNNTTSSTSTSRIIGNSSSSGTAEPEMRGLYILLTLNNDGGMEVLKYAGRLSAERPSVFKSHPVQLAMEVYKSRKDYNYAKFFRLLRDIDTPYLFACVMFKYVETMRKAAIRIMAKTFGSRRKTSEGGVVGVYDQYPLRDLVHLLCFEDESDARMTCLHYGITVVKVRISEDSDQTVEVILWKSSEFCEPRDPVKGHVLPLPPRKMVRTIESKLSGRTRLAICRGEVSGRGATLIGDGGGPPDPVAEAENAKRLQLLQRQQEEQRVQRQQLIESARREEAKRRAQEEKSKRDQLLKLRQERVLQQKLEQKKVLMEEARRQDMERQREQQRQEEERVRLEKERKEAEERKCDAAKQKAEEEARLALQRQEEERCRIAAHQQKLQEEAQRQKQREEQARRDQLRREAEEKQRLQQERERQKQIQLQKQREAELERLRKIEEEKVRKLELEWEEKINFAKKLVALKKLGLKMPGNRKGKAETHASIESFDPLQTLRLKFQRRPRPTRTKVAVANRRSNLAAEIKDLEVTISYEELFYQLGTDMTTPMDLSQLLYDGIAAAGLWNLIDRQKLHASASAAALSGNNRPKTVALFKVGIVIADGHQNQDLTNMIKMWIDSRLPIRKILSTSSTGTDDSDSGSDTFEARTVATFYEWANSDNVFEECNAVLIILPPMSRENAVRDYSSSATLTPKCVLNFAESISDTGAFDRMLKEACIDLVQQTVDGIYSNHRHHHPVQPVHRSPYPSPLLILERIPLRQLLFVTLSRTLCAYNTNDLSGVSQYQSSNLPPHLQRASARTSSDRLSMHCRDVFLFVLNQVCHLQNMQIKDVCASWPAAEFIAKDDDHHHDYQVPSYFANNLHLPSTWKSEMEDPNILQDAIWEICPSLRDPHPSYEEFLHDILDHAPMTIQQECGALFQRNQLTKCLEVAFQWNENETTAAEIVRQKTMYLPLGKGSGMIHQFLLNGMDSIAIRVERQDTPFLVPDVDENEDGVMKIVDSTHRSDRDPIVSGFLARKSPRQSISVTKAKSNGMSNRFGGMILPSSTSPISSPPLSSAKRSLSTPSSTSSFMKRKKSGERIDINAKVDVEVMPMPLSGDLMKCRNFTDNLKSICDEGANLMGFINNDPHLANLIESDDSLKRLMNM
mmetsp:Transcript_27630/g.42294  ORF Transcript_27630/g.42294 Transcript_27630/m.42294 type:complete len:2013 (-) Transcript_27630:135-6173(-)|eukprot:CAMPEP_0194075078 /NCGR_PEP_ID=MMETSP0149-20130528/2116_1 /TAXON_ID=122233 /ORGANISM="Chaetoceros debilis, Strain MM31A-1" /LENGTH=2012 /DNA_ID=CAMNT_0038755435 /DNA_START=70 /DNA_END=6108 /DNA_ORIENTATION=-